MIYSYKDCVEYFGTDYKLKKALSDKKLFLKEKGFYSDSEFSSELELIAAKYPRAVFTGGRAYYYYGMTDVIPDCYHLATKREDTRITDKRVKQVSVNDKLFEYGITRMDYHNVNIPIYSKERLLVDLVRFKTRMPFDYYKEIIGSYRDIVGELDFFQVEDYAALLKNGNRLMEAIQLEVM